MLMLLTSRSPGRGSKRQILLDYAQIESMSRVGKEDGFLDCTLIRTKTGNELHVDETPQAIFALIQMLEAKHA